MTYIWSNSLSLKYQFLCCSPRHVTTVACFWLQIKRSNLQTFNGILCEILYIFTFSFVIKSSFSWKIIKFCFVATTTIPDLDLVSLSSSYLNKTLSDIVLPPPPPENKSGEQMKKLKSLDRRNPFLDSDIPFLDSDIPFLDSDIPFLDQEPNPFLSQDRESPFSDQVAVFFRCSELVNSEITNPHFV